MIPLRTFELYAGTVPIFGADNSAAPSGDFSFLRGDCVHHFSSQSQSDTCRDDDRGAKAGFLADVDCGVGRTGAGVFGGKDGADAEGAGAVGNGVALGKAVVFSQACAHLGQKGVVRDARKVAGGDECRIGAAARAAAYQNESPLLMCPRNERGFGLEAVDGVDDECVGRNEPIHRRLINELRHGRNRCLGIDVGCTGGEDLGLGSTERACQSRQLPVDVAFGHYIAVNERQSADARAGKRLHAPASDAAKTDDADVGGGMFFTNSVSIEAAEAAEAADVGGIHGNCCDGADAEAGPRRARRDLLCDPSRQEVYFVKFLPRCLRRLDFNAADGLFFCC